jgi:hypothetical protein
MSAILNESPQLLRVERPRFRKRFKSKGLRQADLAGGRDHHPTPVRTAADPIAIKKGSGDGGAKGATEMGPSLRPVQT